MQRRRTGAVPRTGLHVGAHGVEAEVKSRRRLVVALVLALGVTTCNRAGHLLIVTALPERPDLIVSLASHEWERLPAAARLAQEHPSAVVLLTIPVIPTIHNCHRCAQRVD